MAMPRIWRKQPIVPITHLGSRRSPTIKNNRTIREPTRMARTAIMHRRITIGTTIVRSKNSSNREITMPSPTNNHRPPINPKMRSRRISCLMLLICSLFFSCADDTLYYQYQVIQDTAWEKDQVYDFTFSIEDNTRP